VDWFEPVMAYCERTGPAFWAEPVNALTNAAFLIAAALLCRRADVRGDPPALALAILTGIVGIGSFLFHTLAVHWSMLADVIPIALFIHGYFLLALLRFLGLGWPGAVAATLAFLAFGFGLTPALDWLSGLDTSAATNGSIGYLPAILALAGVSLGALARGEGAIAARLGAVAALFLVSLAARTLDRGVCAAWPLGSHFLWHCLNACVLYGLVATAAGRRPPRAAAA